MSFHKNWTVTQRRRNRLFFIFSHTHTHTKKEQTLNALKYIEKCIEHQKKMRNILFKRTTRRLLQHYFLLFLICPSSLIFHRHYCVIIQFGATMRVRHSTKLTDLEHKITLKHDRKSNVNNKFHKQSGFVDADSFIDFPKFSINFSFFLSMDISYSTPYGREKKAKTISNFTISLHICRD